MDVALLPHLNAALNAASTLWLISGWWHIRARRIMAHRACMVAACVTSTCFLASYLVYHAHVGSVRFQRTGWIRPVYYGILLTHTVLAMAIVPLVARTLWLAARERFARHAALARWTLPLWLYVSVTGVIVYGMLYHM